MVALKYWNNPTR